MYIKEVRRSEKSRDTFYIMLRDENNIDDFIVINVKTKKGKSINYLNRNLEYFENYKGIVGTGVLFINNNGKINYHILKNKFTTIRNLKRIINIK